MVITIEGVVLLNISDDHLVIQVLPKHNLQASTPVGFVLCSWIMLKHFKMHIAITDIMGKKKINLTYPIQGKEVLVVSTFSYNVQCRIMEHLTVMLIVKEEKWLPEEAFLGRELNTSTGRKVIMTTMDTNKNVIKMDKLAGVTEMVLSLDKLSNNENLEE